jgi:hypothetical protein
MTRSITVEIAPGELIDKLTILAIKLDRIADAAKRANVQIEFDLLQEAYRTAVMPSAEIDRLQQELHGANEQLWDIEDRIRDCERHADFGADFVALARSVYRTNDRRAEIKKAINVLLGSRVVEEKSYSAY